MASAMRDTQRFEYPYRMDTLEKAQPVIQFHIAMRPTQIRRPYNPQLMAARYRASNMTLLTSVSTNTSISNCSREIEALSQLLSPPQISDEAARAMEAWMYWKKDPVRADSWIKVFVRLNEDQIEIVSSLEEGCTPIVQFILVRTEFTSIGGFLLYDHEEKTYELYLYQNNDQAFQEWRYGLGAAADRVSNMNARLSDSAILDFASDHCLPCGWVRKVMQRMGRRLSA